MAVTIKTAISKGAASAPVKTATKVVSPLDELKELADKFGELSSNIAELKTNPVFQEITTIEAELEEVKTKIREKADATLKPEEGSDIAGKHYTVNVTAKGNESKVKEEGGKEAIFTFLGEETFVQLCTFPITQLRAYLNPKQLEEVLETKASKARTVKLKK